MDLITWSYVATVILWLVCGFCSSLFGILLFAWGCKYSEDGIVYIDEDYLIPCLFFGLTGPWAFPFFIVVVVATVTTILILIGFDKLFEKIGINRVFHKLNPFPIRLSVKNKYR